jgi:hypothetical protein
MVEQDHPVTPEALKDQEDRTMSDVRTPRQAPHGGRQAGQGLVEFALVLPILMILFMGLMELALALNATIATNRASQNGGHLAAVLGNQLGADCLILREIEEDIAAPNDPSKIQEVVIDRRAMAGNDAYPGEKQRYLRSGQQTCTLPDNTTVVVPYTLQLPPGGYAEAQRCSALNGCTSLNPPRSTVDNIGVSVKYRHLWATPLNSILNVFAGGDTGWTFTQTNIFRMEPTL